MMNPMNSPFKPELWEYEQPTRIQRYLPARLGDYLIDNGQALNEFTLSYTEDESTTVILSQQEAYNIMMDKYSERIFDVALEYDDDTAQWVIPNSSWTEGNLTTTWHGVIGQILRAWKTYWSTALSNYIAKYKVLTTDADPLVNYDKTSTISTTHGKTITKSGSISSDANTYGLNSPSGGADSEDRTTTYNSLTDTNSGTDTVSEHTVGNIGTVSLQDLQLQEMEVRAYNLKLDLVRSFINHYTHY